MAYGKVDAQGATKNSYKTFQLTAEEAKILLTRLSEEYRLQSLYYSSTRPNTGASVSGNRVTAKVHICITFCTDVLQDVTTGDIEAELFEWTMWQVQQKSRQEKQQQQGEGQS